MIDEFRAQIQQPINSDGSSVFNDRISRRVSSRGGFVFRSALPLFEIACVLVRLDHVASRNPKGGSQRHAAVAGQTLHKDQAAA
jgi:hypothetical protein